MNVFEGNERLKLIQFIKYIFWIQVVVDDPEERLTLETSEGYRIDIETQGNVVTAEVRGDTFFGARHGLETLSQLIAFDEQRDTVQIISAGAVIDRPLFA